MIKKIETVIDNLSIDEIKELIQMCEESIFKIDDGDNNDR